MVTLNEVYHGSTKDDCESLRKNGIVQGLLNRRDSGLFGEGFYCTSDRDIAKRHATTVAEKRNGVPAIAVTEVKSMHTILDASVALEENSIRPRKQLPDWHSDFVNWYKNQVREAAVWTDIPDVTKDDVMDSFDIIPGTNSFDRKQWYRKITEFARETGYDCIFWSRSEIILLSNEFNFQILEILDGEA